VTGSVMSVFAGGTGGIILADGAYFNSYDPRWITAPVPRNGQYMFTTSENLTVGQRVTFDPQPGSDYAPGFETASVALNVQPA